MYYGSIAGEFGHEINVQFDKQKTRVFSSYLKQKEICYGETVKDQCGTEAATTNQYFTIIHNFRVQLFSVPH